MAAPFLRSLVVARQRFHLQHCRCTAVTFILSRPWATFAEPPTRPGDPTTTVTSTPLNAPVLAPKARSKGPRSDEPDYRAWKDKEALILSDIEPVISLVKHILHSDRYMDGQMLTAEHEKIIIQRVLAYHPHSEDKIGCGLDSIMVDRHPQFKHSRCLFVVRSDGGWIDFSYQKCLRAYLRAKYPSHAERFINEHFKRGS